MAVKYHDSVESSNVIHYYISRKKTAVYQFSIFNDKLIDDLQPLLITVPSLQLLMAFFRAVFFFLH